MTGAPRSAYVAGDFIAVRREAVEALGSWEAAGVWHRVCWRSERAGSWVATIAEVALEVMLTEYRAKVALGTVRDAGWLSAERADSRDRTLRWTPLWAAPSEGFRPYVTADSDATSLETVEITTPPPSSPASDDSQLFDTPTALAVVEQPSAIDVEFAEFYALFPRHVARAKALSAYRTARKRASAEAIMAGLTAQLVGLNARPMDKRPHPATWLNQERWCDDAEHAVPIALNGGGRRNVWAESALAGRGEELMAQLHGRTRAIGGEQ